MRSMFRKACAVAFCLCMATPSFADDADQKAFEAFKESYGSFKGVYEKTKEKVDATAEFFGKFNEAVSTWRKACSKEFQDAGIEGITDLTKEQLGAIDSLAESLSEATGISIPENIPEKIKDKISAKLLDSLPQDKKRKFGYMYTLSSVDRQLRENGTYARLISVKEQFEAGGELLGSVDKAVEFMDTFNPKTDGSVTGSLKKIKGALDYMGGFTEGIPLMGDIIKGYADVTEGFVGALEDLDKQLKDCRQGSLGGQLGVDIAVKKKILSEYPGIEGELTLYFSINGDYPELKPIRGWKNESVLLYHGSDDGSGVVALMNAGSFDTMYKYYAALKKSALEPARKLADPETFMNRARAVGDRSIGDHDKRFRGYYARFEGSGSYEFIRVLEAAGKKNSDSYLVSESGRTMEYRLYTNKEDEFAGLCFFSQQFRTDVETLLAKYGDLQAVTVTVKAKDGGKLEGLEILFNGAAVTQLVAKPSGMQFSATVKKGEAYSISVKAAKATPWSQTGLTGPYQTIELETEGTSSGAMRIIADDTIEEKQKLAYSLDLGGVTLKKGDEVFWVVDGLTAGKGIAGGTYTPENIGPFKLTAQIYNNGKRGAVIEKTVTVVPAKETGVTIQFESPRDILVGLDPFDFKIVVSGSKTMERAISYGIREETTGTVFRSPNSWGSKYQPNWKDELWVRMKVPSKPGTLKFVCDLWQYQQGSTTAVIASATQEIKVHSLGLKAPGAVTAMEKFGVSMSVPGEIQSKVKQYGWSPMDVIISGSDWGRTTSPNVTMQLRNDQIKPDGTVEIGCWVVDEKDKVLGLETVKVPARTVSMGTALPGTWEGGPSNFGRKAAIRKRKEGDKEVKSAEVSASLKIAVSQPTSVFYKRDVEEQAIKTWAAQNGGAPVRKIEISGFEGSIAERPVWSRYGGNPWGYVDVGSVQSGAVGKGLLFNGAFIMEIEYSVSGGGTTLGSGTLWWDDMPFVLQQTEQALSEIQGMISSYKISPDAAMTKGDDKEPAKQPKVILTASTTKLRKGDTAIATAKVENASPKDEPFSYEWSGSFSGKGQSVTFLATAGGKQTLSVAVKGARYGLGSASIDFAVEETKVTITKTSPAGVKIPAGSAAAFSASVTTLGGQAPSGLVYRWEPHPEVTFDPHEGSASTTKAKFMKPGKVKVWVDVLEKKDGALKTLGSSDQIELEVVNPTLKLALSKTAPFPGEEMTAKVDAGAETKSMDYRWELSSNAKLLKQSQDATEITFSMTDAKEGKITVNARVPHSGESLGSADARVTARPYTVTAEVLGPLGPKPLVWKEGQGLVEDKTAIKTGQNVRVKATVTPAPKDTVNYSWKANSGTGFGGGSSSNEVMLTRSAKGTAEATVEVKNAAGVLLGTAKASFEVSVSDADEQKAKDRAEKEKKRKESSEKLAQARRLAGQGKLNDALGIVEGVLASDPDNTEAKDLQKDLRARIVKAKTGDDKGNDKEKDNSAGGTTAKDAKDAGKEGKQGSGGKTVGGPGKTGTASGITAAAGGTAAADRKKPYSSGDDPAYQSETRATEADGLYQQYRTYRLHESDPERCVDMLNASIKKYEEALGIVDNPKIRKRMDEIVKLRDGHLQEIKNIRQAKELRSEADKLAKKNKYRDAIDKYQEAMKLYTFPDQQTLGAVIHNLEMGERNEKAGALRAEGDALVKEGKLITAVEKYDQALKAYHPEYQFRQNFEVQVQDVRNRITGARNRRKDGEIAEKRGDIASAIREYEASLKFMSDDELAEHVAELKKRQTETVAAPAGGEDAVRQMYQDFARAYESKSESRVTAFISPDWDAGDGTTLSDLRGYLRNSFSVFDEVKYAISNLTVKKTGDGRYSASYTVTITGRVYENNIRHEERSSVDEEVSIDAKGRVRIRKTSDGKFWVVE